MSDQPHANDAMTGSAEKDNWDDHWSHLDQAATLNPAQQMRHRIVRKLLQKTAQFRPIDKVCDFGSGQGDMAVELHTAFPNAEYVGLEMSRYGVESARRKVPSYRFEVANLFENSPEELNLHRWANHAVCSEVLEHVDDPTLFLQRCIPFLRPGAQIVITVPGGPMSAFDKHIGHRRHFSRASIAEVLVRAGFVVERTYAAGFPFFNLYRLTVILRGKQLMNDVSQQSGSRTRSLAEAFMRAFNVLFRMNVLGSPFGWQIVAVARLPD